MAEVFNIAYCFDENYEQHAAASAMSVISNFALDTKQLAFHFLADVVTPKMATYAADLERKYGCVVVVYALGTQSETLSDAILKTLTERKYWTAAALFRLILPGILSDSVSKVLYLDCDTIVLEDISRIFEFDLDGYAAAAVTDPTGHKDVLQMGVSNYFNSGVLLMDLDYWRNKNIGQECLDYLATPGSISRCIDQDAINKILDGNIQEIPQRWNRQVSNGLSTSNVFSTVLKQASILHFITQNKPWQAWHYNRLKEYYWAYIRASPWKDPVEQQPTLAWQWHQMAIAATREGRLQDAVEHYEVIVQHYLKK